jgi:cytochrome c biogenesis protein CcmG/thiol:disulfide interchange protein DsbE
MSKLSVSRRAIAAGLLLLAVGLAPAAARAEMEGMKIKVGEKAPDFTLKDLSGNPFTLSSLQGKKIVMLDFWATWCNVCKREMPVLEKVYKEYKPKGVEFFGICLDENLVQIKKVLEQKGVTYVTLLDKDAQVATEVYQLSGPIPLKVIIDKKGIVRYSHVGDFVEYPPEINFVFDELLSE